MHDRVFFKPFESSMHCSFEALAMLYRLCFTRFYSSMRCVLSGNFVMLYRLFSRR